MKKVLIAILMLIVAFLAIANNGNSSATDINNEEIKFENYGA